MKEKISEAIKLKKELYRKHPLGCCLHIVLDDGNLEDDDVRHCIGYALNREHSGCLYLAELLLELNEEERDIVYDIL